MTDPQHLTATQLTEPLCYHGEGPVWSPAWGGLRWVDMLAGDLLTLPAEALGSGLPAAGDAEYGEDTIARLHVGTVPGRDWKPVAAFCRPRRTGGYVVGLERGYGLAEDPHEPPTEVVALWEDPNLRMNEGGTDPWGGLFAGSMAYDRTPGAGSLLHIGADRTVSTVLEEVSTSNGIDVTADRSHAYYNDTGAKTTDRFTILRAPAGEGYLDTEGRGSRTGVLARRRVLATPPTLGSGERTGQPASPDGLCVDAAGNTWVAMNRAGQVHQFSPTGQLLTVVEVGAQLTTACTLGGADLRTLFVTTSRENLSDPEPEAGAVFAVRVDIPGKPVPAYGG